jgi:hypothetical protein
VIVIRIIFQMVMKERAMLLNILAMKPDFALIVFCHRFL